MNALNYLLPLITLPFGVGVTPFVNAHRSMGGAAFIWLDNCGKVNIANNAVEWVDANSSAPDGSMLENMKGICLEASISCDITENVVANIEAGINVKEDCSGSNLFCNTMAGCWHGVYFDDQGGANKLLDQGEWFNNASQSTSWNNHWLNNIDDRISGSNLSQFLRWTYSGGDDDPNPHPFPSAVLLSEPCSLTITSCIPYDPNHNEQMRSAAYGDAVGDSSEADVDSLQYAYSDKQTFYRQANQDPSILNLGNALDATYQAKFSSLTETDMGKFEEAKIYLAAGNTSLALVKLAAMQNQNTIDQNKYFIGILIASGYSPNHDADSDTVALVHAIAVQHPFYGGEGVYMARAMLHVNIHDILPQYRKAK